MLRHAAHLYPPRESLQIRTALPPCRRLFNNALSGSLPPEWGQDTAFQRMKGNDTKACPKNGGLLGSQKCEM